MQKSLAGEVIGSSERAGSMATLYAGNKKLHDKVMKLEAKVEDLTQQLLRNHTAEN